MIMFKLRLVREIRQNDEEVKKKIKRPHAMFRL